MYVPNSEPSYAVRQPQVRSPASEVTAQIRCHGASISSEERDGEQQDQLRAERPPPVVAHRPRV